jgi:hypothetical protein
MLKLTYYGQNDALEHTQPDVALTGDPGTDQPVLSAAGYLGGRIMAIKTSAVAGRGVVNVPCDADTMVPFAVLLNGPGEFAGAIGPSGSKRAPMVRALPQFTVDSQAYDDAATFVVGAYVYCGGTTHTNIGLWTDVGHAGHLEGLTPSGICTHIPTASEPWLGVASLL